MKKLFPFLLVLFVVQSCEEPVEITETMVVNQSTIVTINQTNGTSVSFNDVIEGDLNQVVSNFNSITDITIDSLTYSFSNLIGNENASIVSASIEINGITVAVVSDLNIAQEIDNESVFQITDLNVLDQLETSFLNNSSVALNLSGMAISEEGDVSVSYTHLTLPTSDLV